MTTEDWIRYYVPIVNAEIGREDRNEQSIDFFMRLVGLARFDCNDKYYIVTLTAPDMWGDKVLNLMSFYIKPEFRTRYIREVLAKLSKFAIEDKVSYIELGSHINKKLYNFWLKQGYEVSSVRRYL